MKFRVQKRTRIILLFFLGIGLPSLLLGYLAFRGVQNDQALIEKARLDEHRRTAKQVVEFVDEKITAVERTVANAISDSAMVPEGGLAKRLESLIDEHPLVEHVFFFQDSATIRFPAARPLYAPDGLRSSSPSPKRLSRSAPMMQSAERLEFEQRNYPQALIAYQQAIEQAADLNIKGELLNALARVQKKSALSQTSAT
jgi:hypothetical protein